MRFWGKLILVSLLFIVICSASAVPAARHSAASFPASAPSAVELSGSASPVSALPLSPPLGSAQKTSSEPVKIIIASDPHVYPAALHDDSGAYQRFESTGQGKMLSFSDHIMRAFVNDALEESPDAVIITGDLSLNGEKLGHEALAAELKRLTGAGIRVFVIPGNHDINNPSAREIRNNKFYRTDYVSAAQFEEIYAGLGFDGALYRAEDSLSYIAAVKDNLYAVLLDTCVYEPNIKRNASIMGGTVNQQTLLWLEESVKEIKAQNPGAEFVTAMHHNLLQHHPSFDGNYVIQSHDAALPLFGSLGLSLTFSGHIHMQNEMTEEVGGRSVTEITNSSLLIFPFDYSVVEISQDGSFERALKSVNMPRYALEQTQVNSSQEGSLDFNAFTEAVFERRVSRRRGGSAYSEDDLAEARDVMNRINAAFLSGKLNEPGFLDEILQSGGYKLLRDVGMGEGYLDYVLG